MSIYAELCRIQKELKAPKGQMNKFGNYKYRSCEDILESVKPLLENCSLVVRDEVVVVGDRYYVKATATLTDSMSDGDNKSVSVEAYAREADSKKGMDASQVTGATSSYARKYALNGLFCIDDTKDADTQDNRHQPKKNTEQPQTQKLRNSVINGVTEILMSCDEKSKDEVKKDLLDKLAVKNSAEILKENDIQVLQGMLKVIENYI